MLQHHWHYLRKLGMCSFFAGRGRGAALHIHWFDNAHVSMWQARGARITQAGMPRIRVIALPCGLCIPRAHWHAARRVQVAAAAAGISRPSFAIGKNWTKMPICANT